LENLQDAYNTQGSGQPLLWLQWLFSQRPNKNKKRMQHSALKIQIFIYFCGKYK